MIDKNKELLIGESLHVIEGTASSTHPLSPYNIG